MWTRNWNSLCDIVDNISYYLGAPEFIIRDSKYDEYTKDYRTLLLAKEEDGKKSPVALILIQDKIRKEAKDTLEYFKRQEVLVNRIHKRNSKRNIPDLI